MSINLDTTNELYKALVEYRFEVEDKWLYAGEVRVTIGGKKFCIFQHSKFASWVFTPWGYIYDDEWINSGLSSLSTSTGEILTWVMPLILAVPGCHLRGIGPIFKPRKVYPAGEQQELCI